MIENLRKLLHYTKDNNLPYRRCLVKLGCSIITALFISGFFISQAQAASGITIYDYATKKQTTYKDKQVKVTIDGKTVTSSKTPGILVSGVALVPYDDVFGNSLIDAECIYDKNKGTIRISKYGKTITMTLGSKKAKLNSTTVTLPVAPMRVKFKAANSIKVLVPSRFIAEKLGLSYSWNSSSSTVSIVKASLSLAFNHGAPFEYTGALGKVTINGKSINLGNMPSIITNNTAMVRAKRVFTDASIGATYTYQGSDKSITLTRGSNTLVMNLGSKTAYLNGNPLKMETAPILVTNLKVNSSYVMVPGGFTASCLGFDYQWNNSIRTSTITTQKEQASSNGSGTAPELGDSGEITEVGSILGQWVATDTAFGRSKDIHEIGNPSQGTNTIYSIERDYNNLKQNAETFVLKATGAFGNISSYVSDNIITVKAAGTICADTTYQAFGVISNFVNTISASYSDQDKGSTIKWNVLSSDYDYDLTLSEDKQSLYVTVYYNSLTQAVLGTNNACDYITLTGVKALKVTTNQMTGAVNIELPFTTNCIGDINTIVSGAKYINSFSVIGGADKTQLLIGTIEGYEYHVSQNGNQYTLIFMTPGAANTSPSGADGNNSNSSDTLDKNSCEIIIPRPAGLNNEMIKDEDNYFNHNFVLRMQGDYTSIINQSSIINYASTVTGITVSLNSSNETVIEFKTSKLQGYEYGMDDTSIYINVGNPKEIYKNIVVLDPGHGGGANGAQYFGTKEKDLNYKILYTIGKNYFNQNTKKLKVYYTRITDVDMSLGDRAAFASRYGADLFVSLHMNASLSKTAYGTEVYYSSSNNSPNNAGLTSKRLADLFAGNVSSRLGTLNRGSRAERYTVVHKNTVPAVLVELGFLSNENDYRLLSDASFQENAAKTIYDTLLQVFESYPTGR